MDELEKTKNKLKRALKSLADAENLLEEKSRALYTLNQSLEQQVIERTKELEAAKNIAVKANKAKDRFVANISHELRTPLNGIIGMLSFLKNSTLDDQQRGFLKLLDQSSELLLELINDLLDQAKISSGELSIELKSFKPEKLVESVINILYYKAYEAKVTLNFQYIESTPLEAISDQRKISQILLNLVGNAIKFTPKGRILVLLYSEDNHLTFEVVDSGVGIPSEKIDHIYKPFQQVDNSDNRKYGGSGLGLSISKSFVEALGGKINVTSQEGVGTVFKFSIENKAQTKTVVTQEKHPQKCIALCLADQDLEGIISTYLQDWGLECHIFYDTNELFNSNKYELFDEIIISEEIFNYPAEPYKLNNINLILQPDSSFKDTNQEVKKWISPFFRSDLTKLLKSNLVGQNKKTTGEELNTKKLQAPIGFKILLVEDNLINQKIALHVLASAGFETDLAENGKEALEKCHENFYKIILMDFNMPVMNGIEATREIRDYQKKQKSKSYIIAMTASAMKSAKEECFEAGMDDFLTKPIEHDELIKRIKRVAAKTSQN